MARPVRREYVQSPKKVIEEKKSEPVVKKKISSKERIEHEALEKEIQKFEQEKSLVTEKLNGGGDHTQLLEWSQRIKTLSEEIDAKTTRWLQLSELF